MSSRVGWILPGLAVLVLAALVPQGASAAPNWSVGPAAGSSAQSRSGSPGTTVPSASCSGLVGTTINVGWTALPGATTYAVIQTKTPLLGGTPTTTTVATVNAPATTYANTSLGGGTYSYQIQTTIGTKWVGPVSASGNSRTVTIGLLCS